MVYVFDAFAGGDQALAQPALSRIWPDLHRLPLTGLDADASRGIIASFSSLASPM